MLERFVMLSVVRYEDGRDPTIQAHGPFDTKATADAVAKAVHDTFSHEVGKTFGTQVISLLTHQQYLESKYHWHHSREWNNDLGLDLYAGSGGFRYADGSWVIMLRGSKWWAKHGDKEVVSPDLNSVENWVWENVAQFNIQLDEQPRPPVNPYAVQYFPEFDYDLEALAISLGPTFHVEPGPNDVCPAIINSDDDTVAIYCDYADPNLSDNPEERKSGDMKQFQVSFFEKDDSTDGFASDSWVEIQEFLKKHYAKEDSITR